MARPRITKKIARRLGGIESMLESAMQECPVVGEDGTISGETDLFVGCQTERDVEEVRDAAVYVVQLIGHLRQKHSGRTKGTR